MAKSKFYEILEKVKASTKGLVNAENAEAVASLGKTIDELEEAYKATEEELTDTKSALVDFVKNTSFSKPSGEDKLPDEEGAPSLDEIMEQELNKIK